MHKKNVKNSIEIRLVSIALALVILSVGGTAYAFQSYLTAFESAFPAAVGTRIDVCVLCHNQASGGSRNSYGSDFADSAIGNHTFNAALAAANSDGAGGTNAAEIAALTFPGDPNDPAAAGPTISTTSPLPPGTVGTAYSQQLAATGGTTPYSWSITSGSPPAGLTLSDNGVLSGTPTAAGTSNFTIMVSGGGTSSAPFALTINPAGTPDTTPPVVSFTSPDNNAVNVPVDNVIVATFNEAIDNTTVDNTSFFVTFNAGADNVLGTVSVSLDNLTVTFTPSAPLLDNTVYTATLDNTITDLAGNALSAPYVWSFDTGPGAAPPPPPPPPPSGDGDGGCAIAGTGGGVKELAGAYGAVVLAALVLAFGGRRKKK